VDHLRHFGLSEDPFRDEPRPRDFCETRAAHEALLRAERGLRQGRGLGVVSGEPGSGKSMLLRRLLEGLEEEVFEASMLVVLPGAADAGALLARFAKHLGVEEHAPERQALLGQIFEQLAIVREEGRQAVLLVDDAELLGRAALAELVGLLHLEYEERRLLSLVLAGAPALDAALAAEAGLAHRVDFRGRLAALDRDDSDAYLAHRVGLAGGDPAILAPDALEAVHRLGRGLPGLIHRLADNALFEAFLCGRRRVTRGDVERAHRDLGFAGAPSGPRPPEPAAAPAAQDAPAGWQSAGDRPPAARERQKDPVAWGPFSPDGDSLGDLDSELEAIFEGAEDGPPRRLRVARDEGLVAAELLEE
jgi:MSHA biogenesis protein MshM